MSEPNKRSLAAHRLRTSAPAFRFAACAWLLASLSASGPLGCATIRAGDASADGGELVDGAASVDDDSGDDDGAVSDGAQDGAPHADSADAGSNWDDAQRALAALRSPGPATAQGSAGFCTDNYFVWREGNGALHAWSKDGTQIDYAFKAQRRPFFAPSDTFVPVDVPPTYAKIALYKTSDANTLVDSIDYPFNWAATQSGIVRADQRENNADLNGTKVRLWDSTTQTTTDITATLLATQQPPQSFGHDELVIPGSVNAPYPLWIVNIAKKTTTSVTFDGGIGLRQTLSTPKGLLVSYARSGPTSALRLYKDNLDDAISRFELGDELANRPSLYPDSPTNEHQLLAKIAIFGSTLIYDSAFGLFAYDMDSSSLKAVQLGPNKTLFATDVMCVMEGAGLLVYRGLNDPIGQVWVVPLASVL